MFLRVLMVLVRTNEIAFPKIRITQLSVTRGISTYRRKNGEQADFAYEWRATEDSGTFFSLLRMTKQPLLDMQGESSIFSTTESTLKSSLWTSTSGLTSAATLWPSRSRK